MLNTERIKKLREEADRLEAADNAFNSLSAEYKLAIALHDNLCHWNHADGCSWHYEITGGIHDFCGTAHSDYLQKATTIVEFCKSKDIDEKVMIDLVGLIKIT